MELANRVAMVTGGGSGIGYAVARTLAVQGGFVYIVGRRRAELEKAALEIGSGVYPVQGDVTRLDDLERIYAHIREKHGKLDSPIVNAGIAEFAKLSDVSEEHYDRTLGLNARATLFTVQKALPLMSAGSTIVLVGSVADAIGTPGYTAYNASKAAMRSFARTWTSELAERGIRVNVVSPGPTETPMMAAANEDVRTTLKNLIPLGRVGRPEEVAAAVCFLASEQSSFIAGAELCVDGGMTQV